MIDREGAYCWQDQVNPEVCHARCFVGLERVKRRNEFFSEMLAKVDLFLSPSHFHRNYLLENRIPSEKLLVNKNGVRRPTGAERPRDSARELTFAFLGGPGEIKGFELIKSAFRDLKSRSYRLLLVDAAKNLDRSWRLDLDFDCQGLVEVVEPFSQESIDLFFNEIDVLLFPSQWKESFGLVVREAMVRGVWVVATDCGGPSEDLVDGENGNIIPLSKDPSYLLKVVQSLVDRPSKVRSFQEQNNGASTAVRFVDEQATELASYFLSCLDRPNS